MDYCYLNIAHLSGDFSLCEEMQSEEYKKYCQRFSEGGDPEWDHINTELIQAVHGPIEFAGGENMVTLSYTFPEGSSEFLVTAFFGDRILYEVLEPTKDCVVGQKYPPSQEAYATRSALIPLSKHYTKGVYFGAIRITPYTEDQVDVSIKGYNFTFIRNVDGTAPEADTTCHIDQ